MIGQESLSWTELCFLGVMWVKRWSSFYPLYHIKYWIFVVVVIAPTLCWKFSAIFPEFHRNFHLSIIVKISVLWGKGYKCPVLPFWHHSSLIFCLDVLSVIENGYWNSLLLLCYCFFVLSVLSMFASLYLEVLILGACIFVSIISSWWIGPFYYYMMSFFVSFGNFCVKVCFVWYKFSHSSSHLASIYVEYLFNSFTFMWRNVREGM